MPTFLGRRVSTSAIVPQAPRPYTTPAASSGRATPAADGGIAQAIAGLGSTFTNGTARALQQEQLTKLADQNELTQMVAGAIGPDGVIVNPRNASIAASLGVLDPAKYGRLNAIQAATTEGVDSPKAAQFLTGLGEYRATPLYGERDFAHRIATQGMQEATKLRVAATEAANRRAINDDALETVVTPEGPRLVRRRDAAGQAPLLSTDQVRGQTVAGMLPGASPAERSRFAFGAQPATEVYNATTADGTTVPATVNPDGTIVDLNTKQPLTGVKTLGKLQAATSEGLSGDSGVGKDVLSGRISTERAVGLIDNLATELDKPNSGVSVGFLGGFSEVANNIRSQVESGAKAIGGMSARDELRGADPQAREVAGTVDRIMQENSAKFAALQQQGIDTARIRALIEDLAYAQAKANDPSGRVSNQDVERAGRQVGAGLGDPVAMKQVLSDLRERTIVGQEVRERNSSAFLKNGQTLPAWNAPFLQNRSGRTAPPAIGQPAPTAQPAPGQTVEETWVRGPDGKMQRAK